MLQPLLVIEPVLKGGCILKAVTFYVCDATRSTMNIYARKGRIYGHLPFAFAVYLMLGEGDFFVVQSYTDVQGNLSYVLISRPL